MSENAAAMVRHRDATEPVAGHIGNAVMPRHPLVGEGVVGRQQFQQAPILADQALEEELGFLAQRERERVIGVRIQDRIRDHPREVNFVNMGGSDTRFAALHTGSIDATPLSLPFFVIAKRQGLTVLGSASDVIEMATVGIGTSTRKIQQEREQVKKMVRAQLDTLHWIKSQKAEVVPFLQKVFGLDEGVAVESHAIYSRLLIEDARPLPEAIKTVLEQQGKPDLPLDRVVDATVVQEVLRERR